MSIVQRDAIKRLRDSKLSPLLCISILWQLEIGRELQENRSTTVFQEIVVLGHMI